MRFHTSYARLFWLTASIIILIGIDGVRVSELEAATPNPYQQITEARKLIALRQAESARLLLSELELGVTNAHALLEIYKCQIYEARMRKDTIRAEVCYKKIFDLVVNPKSKTTDISSIVSPVLQAFNEFSLRAPGIKNSPETLELRKNLMEAIESRMAVSSKVTNLTESALANAQLDMARSLVRLGKREDALAAFAILFSKYPGFMAIGERAIDIRYEWVEAHGYQRESPERVSLLENVYTDPGLKDKTHLANIGVLLGNVYSATRDTKTERHHKELVERIENILRAGNLSKDDKELIDNNYEFALANYARALKARGELGMAEQTLKKLRANFGDGEGGKFADRNLKEIAYIERRKHAKIIALAICSVAIASGLLFYKRVLPRMKTT